MDNFMKDEKKLKLDEISKKTEKMRKIKEIFGKTSEPYSGNKLINDKMFTKFSESSLESPYKRTDKFAQFEAKRKKHENLNYESDFEQLLRKKEL